MEFKVLTKTERKWLRMVETSEEDARQIIERCTPLLEFVEGLPTTMRGIKKRDADMLSYRQDVGCPHCGPHLCSSCPWDVLLHILPKPKFEETCTEMSFGGITLHHVMKEKRLVEVTFSPEEAEVRVFLMDVIDVKTAKTYRSQIREAKRFLIAHIEWAEGRLDGTL